jgi:hypothetical protein
MELNNFLQRQHGNADLLTWEFACVGPQNDCRWIGIAYCVEFFVNFSSLQADLTVRQIVRGIEHGRGENKQKGAAAEIAAYQTLVVLRGY